MSILVLYHPKYIIIVRYCSEYNLLSFKEITISRFQFFLGVFVITKRVNSIQQNNDEFENIIFEVY